MTTLSDTAIFAAQKAGACILDLYSDRLEVQTKSDGSPLTEADRLAHLCLTEILGRTGIQVVSEENPDLQLDATRYWLIDPLDGTKDFLAKNDEFTVNIALIQNHAPVLGVVYAPALNEWYVGEKGNGAWYEKNGAKHICTPLPRARSLRMAVSRFHDHPDVDLFQTDNAVSVRLAMGSSLKYGRLASGEVDVYPRLVGSSEWDTAAGQALLESIGGQVLDWHTQKPLEYGKAGRRNPRLLAFRSPYTAAEFRCRPYERTLL